MSKHTIYAYVIPDDAVVEEASMIQRINEFISGRQWLCPDVWSVSQKHETGEREVGLNIALPEPYQEPKGWFSDIEAIATLCVQLRHEFKCDFVIGIAEDGNHAEDILEIEDDLPDIQFLKKFIGVEPPNTAVQP
ncbi:hypothetical protein [Paracidovorax sp. MALMAid1276]|uniref:hypothetical protein n=1 Tax=Paracidovorax sp. MALMAid1276 TaxID=3411631 RepID=UPI003B9AF4C8